MKRIIKILLVVIIVISQIKVYALYKDDASIKNEFHTINFNIVLNGNGGTYNDNSSVLINGKHMSLPTPYRKGYTFTHYSNKNTTKRFSTYINDITTVEKLEFYANWNKKNYKITYTLNGGTLNQEKTTYTIDDEFEIENPEKENYVFIGWTGTNGLIPEKNLYINKGTTEDIILVANWIEETYQNEEDLQKKDKDIN